MNDIKSNQIAQYRYYKNVNQGMMSYVANNLYLAVAIFLNQMYVTMTRF